MCYLSWLLWCYKCFTVGLNEIYILTCICCMEQESSVVDHSGLQSASDRVNSAMTEICNDLCYNLLFTKYFWTLWEEMPSFKFVFLKEWYVSTVISVNPSHCLCNEVVGGWGVIFSCRGLVLVVTVLPTWSHIPIMTKGLVLLLVVDRNLLVSWSEKQ